MNVTLRRVLIAAIAFTIVCIPLYPSFIALEPVGFPGIALLPRAYAIGILVAGFLAECVFVVAFVQRRAPRDNPLLVPLIALFAAWFAGGACGLRSGGGPALCRDFRHGRALAFDAALVLRRARRRARRLLVVPDLRRFGRGRSRGDGRTARARRAVCDPARARDRNVRAARRARRVFDRARTGRVRAGADLARARACELQRGWFWRSPCRRWR